MSKQKNNLPVSDCCQEAAIGTPDGGHVCANCKRRCRIVDAEEESEEIKIDITPAL